MSIKQQITTNKKEAHKKTPIIETLAYERISFLQRYALLNTATGVLDKEY